MIKEQKSLPKIGFNFFFLKKEIEVGEFIFF